MRELVKRGFTQENGVDMFYVELSCDSSETKPTTGIIDGSVAIESNTGKGFLFNEKSGDWVEV